MEIPLGKDIQYSGAELRKKTEDMMGDLRDTLELLPEFQEAVFKRFYAGKIDLRPLIVRVHNIPFQNHGMSLIIKVHSSQVSLEGRGSLDNLDVTIRNRFIRNPRNRDVPKYIPTIYESCRLYAQQVDRPDSEASMVWTRMGPSGEELQRKSNSQYAEESIVTMINEIRFFQPRHLHI